MSPTIYRTADALPLGAANLLDLCLRLRMACNGSADPISVPETHAALAYLRKRLLNWTPSQPSSKRFDDCVRRLACEAIKEVEDRYDWHLSQYQRNGVGIPMERHPEGSWCPSCKGVYSTTGRIGTPCMNFLCPDRRVGAAAVAQ